MLEIENINAQLSDIVTEMKIPICGGGDKSDYLCCIAAGMIQFVCVRAGRDNYKSLTQDKICIHPGSVMFKQDPLYIVAGEIVRTSRMYAMSVSPLTKAILNQLSPDLLEKLDKSKPARTLEMQADIYEKTARKNKKDSKKKDEKKDDENDTISFGSESFEIKKVHKKKQAQLTYDAFVHASRAETDRDKIKTIGGIKAKVIYPNGFTLLEGEKLSMAVKIAKALPLEPIAENKWNRKLNVNIHEDDSAQAITQAVDSILKVTVAKQKSKEYGFICLFTDGKGTYWNKVSRGFATALNESIASLEILADEGKDVFSEQQLALINEKSRSLHEHSV